MASGLLTGLCLAVWQIGGFDGICYLVLVDSSFSVTNTDIYVSKYSAQTLPRTFRKNRLLTPYSLHFN